jgi:hypothetical protein
MRRQQSMISACLIASTVIVTFVASLYAHAQPQQPGDLGEFFLQRTKASGFQPPDNSTLILLKDPIAVPSTPFALDIDQDLLGNLWSVPITKDGKVVNFGKDRISKLIGDFFSDISKFSLGTATLDAAAQTQLKTALKVLFLDPDARTTLTTGYTRYKKWKDDREALIKKIQDPENAAQVNVLTTRLRNLDDSINLSGIKSQVETAIQIVERFTSGKDQFAGQLEAARQTSKSSDDVNSLKSLYARLASRSAWNRLSLSSGQAGLPTSVTVSLTTANNQQTTATIPLVDISYDFIVLDINISALQSEILTNRAWKRRDSLVISDGDAATAQNTEQVPSYLTHVLVVRNIDIGFDTKSPEYLKFAKAFNGSSYGSTDLLSFGKPGLSPAYSLPGHIFIPFPQIIAVVVTSPPKIPNPSQGLNWD